MTGSRFVSGLLVRRRTAPLAALGAFAMVVAGPTSTWAAGGEGGGGLIELNWTLFVQVVNFVVLLYVLYKIAYKPLVSTLEARSAAIKQQLAEAQAAREEAQRQLVEFETRLQAAQAEAAAVRDRALRDAAETREKLTAEARQQATRLVEAARAEIEQDVRRAKTELRGQVGTLAIEIAERLIQKSLRDEDHQRLVEEALARVERG